MKVKQILGYFKFIAIGITIILVLNYAIGIVFLNFGTPFGILLSKYKLDKYYQGVYGDDVSPHGLPMYNPKSSSYHYKLITKNNEVISELSYKVSKQIISDSNFKLDINLPNEIKTIDNELGEDIYLPKPFMYYGIDGNQDFSKHPLKRSDKLYLLGIINTDIELTPNQSKEKFLEIVSFIYKRLGNKYNFTSSQIIYIDVNGSLETYMSAKESTMTYEKVKSKIRVKEHGEVEEKFINQLKAVRNGQLTKDKLEMPYKQ
jgi:hypothetical protein